ncbi:MAG TPA: hypothetical protein VJ865_07700 [Gemmatimonadaceae bacterium]|nr:hypothetical protein [Gemmatimonadaceae bacterium]
MMHSELSYRLPAFRDNFRHLNDEDYVRIEDVLEAYLLLTIRFVIHDIATGRVSLTGDNEALSMENGPSIPKPTVTSPE